ncbi:hypothetical protein [Microbacterium sp. NPDC058389]|uniref:hypothetical protein n=1 Tax=Microbacterium sp. NPDC058389 TaxID=3346475 RepID=UPI00365E4890
MATNRGEWFAEGWDAARVAAFTAEQAECRRAEGIAQDGLSAADEAGVQSFEAMSLYFSLLARLDRHEYVSVDEMAEAIEAVSRTSDRALIEEIWDT